MENSAEDLDIINSLFNMQLRYNAGLTEKRTETLIHDILGCNNNNDLFNKVTELYNKNKSDKIKVVAITSPDCTYSYTKEDEKAVYKYIPRPKSLKEDLMIMDIPPYVKEGVIAILIPFIYPEWDKHPYWYNASNGLITYCDYFFSKIDNELFQKAKEN